jgi:lysophospholipase L1-like esterase
MKPVAIALLLLLAAPATFFGAPTIVTFGASVTAPRKGVQVYTELLARDLLFEGQPVILVNAGVGGNTSKMARDRFEKDVLSKRPQVVVIMLGINDATVDVWKKPPATAPRVSLVDYRANLTAMIRALKPGGVRVILMTTNPISWSETTRKLYSAAPYRPDDPEGFNVLLRDYAQAVRDLAQAEGVGLVDVYNKFKELEARPTRKVGYLTSDGMHPENEGHRVIADLIIEHLAADPRFTRQPFTLWHRSGEVVEMHPRSTDITHDTTHPAVLGPALVKLGDGAVMSVYSTPTSYGGPPGETYIAARITRDGGRTWTPERELTRLPDARAAHPTAHRARDGSLHLFFLGYINHGWKDGNPTDQTRSDLWAVRSRDEGQTWSPPQRIFEGYTGSTNGAAETHRGALVVPFSHYVANPGRLVGRCSVSADGGKTWRLSNALDIGGAGDHEGALEPCVIELKDKRLWMLIRTSRKFFWESFSTDGGFTWSAAAPTRIESSHSPGHLIRLHDGRLAMAWNPPPAGRRELHLAFSSDEGRSWSPSAVIARGSTTYAFLMEKTPGELWAGFMDAHGGWGKTPRARHLKIALKDVISSEP